MDIKIMSKQHFKDLPSDGPVGNGELYGPSIFMGLHPNCSVASSETPTSFSGFTIQY